MCWALGVQNRGVTHRDCAQRWRSAGLRRVRHVHRHLPRGRAYLRHLSLQDPAVGDERTSPPSAPTAVMAARPPWACAATTTACEIVRGDNRDKSGINGDFFCIKGRYAFDFANHTERLTKPLVRQADGKFAAVSWEQALDVTPAKLREIRDEPRWRKHWRHRLELAPPTRKTTCCRSWPARCSAPIISITTAPPTTPRLRVRWRAQRHRRQLRCATP